MENRKKFNIVNIFRRIENPIWLTVYSDLVTNLTLFFLIDYAFTRLSVDERTEILLGLSRSFTRTGSVEVRAEKVIKDFQQQQVTEKIEQLVKTEQFTKYANFEIDEKLIKIVLKVPILFDSGSAELKLQAYDILDEIIPLLKMLPYTVVVEGHTDNIPVSKSSKYLSNWELSAARAYSVVKYFVSQKGLQPQRFVIAGYGEFKPIAPNDTEENRAKNRRIEIKIIRSSKQQ